MTDAVNEKVSIRINKSDRPFLDDECLRIMQAEFERTSTLKRPSLADVLSALLSELREHRQRVSACTCGANTTDEPRLR